MIDIALLLIPVSGCTCFSTLNTYVLYDSCRFFLLFRLPLYQLRLGRVLFRFLGLFLALDQHWLDGRFLLLFRLALH